MINGDDFSNFIVNSSKFQRGNFFSSEDNSSFCKCGRISGYFYHWYCVLGVFNKFIRNVNEYWNYSSRSGVCPRQGIPNIIILFLSKTFFYSENKIVQIENLKKPTMKKENKKKGLRN